MKMRRSPRRRGDFTPAVAQHPANEQARALIVTAIAQQRPKTEDEILLKRIKLVEQRAREPSK